MEHTASRQRLYAALLGVGACILLFRTTLMIAQGYLGILLPCVAGLLLVELALDFGCLLGSIRWWVAGDEARARLPLRLGGFAPRSTPIVIEKGFYTEWWSQFSADGELLVSIPLPVRFRSGTDLDRLRDLVRTEVVRRLAGRRVCPALDREYRYRRSLESGRAGSTRLPGFKLDTLYGFAELKNLYPGLRRIEDKQELAALAQLANGRGRLAAVNALLGMMKKDKPSPPLLA